MKRFHEDLPAIKRRQRQIRSMETSGGRWSASKFHVAGRLRKRSPFASCAPSQHCMCCEAKRVEGRQRIKRHRAQRHSQIADGMLS